MESFIRIGKVTYALPGTSITSSDFLFRPRSLVSLSALALLWMIYSSDRSWLSRPVLTLLGILCQVLSFVHVWKVLSFLLVS